MTNVSYEWHVYRSVHLLNPPLRSFDAIYLFVSNILSDNTRKIFPLPFVSNYYAMTITVSTHLFPSWFSTTKQKHVNYQPETPTLQIVHTFQCNNCNKSFQTQFATMKILFLYFFINNKLETFWFLSSDDHNN